MTPVLSFRLRPPGRNERPLLAGAGLVLALCQPVWLVNAQAQPTPVAPVATPHATTTTAGVDDAHAYGERQARWLLGTLQADTAHATAGASAELRGRLRRALDEHPDTRAATASLHGARAATRETQAAALPQLSLDAETGRRGSDTSTLQGTPDRNWQTGSVGLMLRHPLHDFGALDAQVAASAAFADGVAHRTEARRADLALRAAQSSLDVARARRQLELMRIHVQAREEMVQFLERRHALGGGSLGDVLRARTRLSEAQGALSQSQARDQASTAAYAELLLDAPPAQLDFALPPPQDLDLVMRQPAQAVAHFPVLRSAQAAVQTAERELEATRLRERPRLELELGVQNRDIVGHQRSGTDWQAGLVFRHTLYNGGADRARAAQATARLDEASEQLRNTRLQLERSLRQTLAEDAVADDLLASRRQGVQLAVDALRGVREQFAYRRGTLLDLMTAQDAVQGAALAWIDAEHNRALVRWRLAYFTAELLPWVQGTAIGAVP
ncbi:MAG: hypothetical protein RL375_698 [Pseudomonadota bacterium]|jgi:OMF family outer membrane factor